MDFICFHRKSSFCWDTRLFQIKLVNVFSNLLAYPHQEHSESRYRAFSTDHGRSFKGIGLTRIEIQKRIDLIKVVIYVRSFLFKKIIIYIVFPDYKYKSKIINQFTITYITIQVTVQKQDQILVYMVCLKLNDVIFLYHNLQNSRVKCTAVHLLLSTKWKEDVHPCYACQMLSNYEIKPQRSSQVSTYR